MDTLANSLNSIKVAEKKKKANVSVKPASKLLGAVLNIMHEQAYVGEFNRSDDGLSGHFTVKLVGKINNCGSIKPRFAVKKDEWEKYELRYLPARDIGILIVATSEGMMTHHVAKEKQLGGRLICFVY